MPLSPFCALLPRVPKGAVAVVIAGILLCNPSVCAAGNEGNSRQHRHEPEPKSKGHWRPHGGGLDAAHHRKPHGEACWVFNHLNKAGGETIKSSLRPHLKSRNIRTGSYGSLEWGKGSDYARVFSLAKNRMTWGSYAEGLRPLVPDSCLWFTVFRHPVARLVSTYFHCQEESMWKDPLCGASVLKVDSMNLLKFAEHWGNFALRQFALAFVTPDEILNSAAAQQCPECPGWYKLKLYLEGPTSTTHPSTAPGEGSSTPTLVLGDPQEGSPSVEVTAHSSRSREKTLESLLAPVQRMLRDKYTAVGILESFNATARLFNRALEVPDFDWVKAHNIAGNQEVDSVSGDEEREVLRDAWEDADIKKFIALDLLLYEQAVSVHVRQLEHYRLS